MKLKLVAGVLLIAVYACSADYSALSYTDRPCGSNLTNLWLDVVAVVDNSLGMTNSGLRIVAANIASIFSDGTRIGTNPSEPRTTRLALVTYNSQATVKADLDTYQSIDDLYNGVFGSLTSVSNSYDSYLEVGLAAAAQILQNRGSNRSHYQQVILVYASSYQGSGPLEPLPVAMRLKTSGVKIITVAYVQEGTINLEEKLEKVASPGMNFTSTQGSVRLNVQGALLEANCFCPYNWIQYRESYSDTTSKPYGICIRPYIPTAVWRAARSACSKVWHNSYLANEYTPMKHQFILDVIKGYFQQPYIYHIGLSLINGAWTWDQPNGWPQPTLQKWLNWALGYPVVSSSMTAGWNVQSDLTLRTFWQNTGAYTTAASYVCETYSCDTDNYCDSDGSDD